MRYKTIMLELLPQYPRLYEQLRTSGMLLTALDQYALALKNLHQELMSQLAESLPGCTPIQLSSESLEMALAEMQNHLQSASEPSETDETFSLDAAMKFLACHTPHE